MNPWILGIYATYLLLPLVPTVVIYQMFPRTTVSLGGFIHGLRLNAGGAFAAYMSTVMLATWLAKSAVGVIEEQASTWTIIEEVNALDTSGKPLNPADLEHLAVAQVPPFRLSNGPENDSDPGHPVYSKRISIDVPVQSGKWPQLVYTVPEYDSFPVEVASRIRSRDEVRHTIELAPIKFQKNQLGVYAAAITPLSMPTAAARYPSSAPAQ